MTATPLHARADAAASAEIRSVDGRNVVWFRIAGGKHHGAIGVQGSATVERAVRLAGRLEIPLLGELDTSGAELRDGVAALHAWGRLARELVRISGRVPTLLAVTGACVSGPALALGLFDHVVMTEDAFAYVTGPESVAEFTGVRVSRNEIGGAAIHARTTGVASMVVPDDLAARDALEALLWYLPDHHLADPPLHPTLDPHDRRCAGAGVAVPARSTAAYDVRIVIADVCDHDSFLEIRAAYAPNLVTGYATIAGRPIGVVANQPLTRAGTLDIEASRKAARFVAACDVFNLPIITFVDTPGFEPGRDLEWRGMIRHGAELVHAYCAASVPRVCVVLRKAYGGAYIVMDSRGIGNDLCVAWPGAEIAVMGAAGAVAIINRGRSDDGVIDEYRRAFENPYRAAERGFVDAVIDPGETRRVVAGALQLLATKRDAQPARRHSNSPL
ncbi:MAG TPA: carboxyl transferase domain-containing protein [Acidimicrobiia bacterium]|nr:carboxyl transferase domain-containing protein [Acidimicrobiia bacterium]